MGKTSNVLRVIDDHGEFAGLADDDHSQYLLADGTRLESVSPGHRQLLGATISDGTPVVLIADGATDVTAILRATWVINPSAGTADSGVIYILPSETITLYNDGGTDVVTLECKANGSVEVARTAGSRTYTFLMDEIHI